MQQNGRPVVEKMGVVDEDQQWAPASLFDQHLGITPDQRPEVFTRSSHAALREEERGERSEGQPLRRFRGADAPMGHPALLGPFDAAQGERGLAHPGRPGNHRPPPRSDGPGHLGQLLLSAHDRPPGHARRYLGPVRASRVAERSLDLLTAEESFGTSSVLEEHCDLGDLVR